MAERPDYKFAVRGNRPLARRGTNCVTYDGRNEEQVNRLTIACPRCAAPPTWRCRSADGRSIFYRHRARREAAKRTKAGQSFRPAVPVEATDGDNR